MGYDWHPQCLKCEMCKKVLQPGRHSEHTGKPYCDIPCYQALFGPEGYGRGGVEAHKAFGNGLGETVSEEKSALIALFKAYNNFHQGSPYELKYKEVNSTVLVEGVMKIFWGLKKPITVAGGANLYMGRRESMKQEDLPDQWRKEMLALQKAASIIGDVEDDPPAKVKDDRSVKFNIPSPEQDEEEESLSSTHQRNASLDPSILSSMQEDLDDFQPQSRHRSMTHVMTEGQQPVIFRRSSSFKGNKRLSMKRRSAAVRKSQRFSAMNADNQPSSFTPPADSAANVRVLSTYTSNDVIKQLLMKYKVMDDPSAFSLYLVYDSGRTEKCPDGDFPLITRLKAGPDDNVAKLYITESNDEGRVDISAEAAQYIKFQLPELELFLKKFAEEEEKQCERLRRKFQPIRDEIQARIDEVRQHQE